MAMEIPFHYAPVNQFREETPESLVLLCLRKIAKNPEAICDRVVDSGGWSLKSEVALPQVICEKLVNIWQDIIPNRLNDKFLNMFQDLSSTRLKKVMLRNSSMTDEGLKIVLSHGLQELDISDCRNLTTESFKNLNQNGKDLISLILCKNVLGKFPKFSKRDYRNKEFCKFTKMQECPLNTPKLRRLTLHDYKFAEPISFFRLLRSLKMLTYLDLSGCVYLGEFTCVKELKNLWALILHSAVPIQKAISAICVLKNLRLLDISQEIYEYGIFKSPSLVLEKIVHSLPNLSRLDISGTNLAGCGNCAASQDNKEERCDIPGLQSRMKNPLEFLGLYSIASDACRRHYIPANIASLCR